MGRLDEGYPIVPLFPNGLPRPRHPVNDKKFFSLKTTCLLTCPLTYGMMPNDKQQTPKGHMKFVYLENLSPAERAAYKKGTGVHGDYIVVGNIIAARKVGERDKGWRTVIEGCSKNITEVK